ncbi:MAG: multidrug effflux MFS transporter, partial [Alphaproteobacteria bacterium]|nr:multidrug effflux MFS transporter [Alphaproteobacteria bacterium]
MSFTLWAMLRPGTSGALALLTALVLLGSFSMSLYLPSMPSLVPELGTDVATAMLTLTAYFASFALGQLAFGPLSDRYGRRPILLTGLLIYVGATAICARADTIETLIFGRACQALGACTNLVVARAMVRDSYDEQRAAEALAIIGLAMSLSPALGPVLGGLLQVWAGWRANFVVLAVAGAILLALCAWLAAETNRNPDARALAPGRMARNYATLLTDRVFLGYTLAFAANFSALFAYLTGAPFVLIDQPGLTPAEFGFTALVNAIGYITGSFIAARFGARIGVERMAKAGAIVALIGGIAMAGLTGAGLLSVLAILAPMAVYLAGMGLVVPSAMSSALALYPRFAGTASACLGFVQMALSACASYAVGHIQDFTEMPMKFVFF